MATKVSILIFLKENVLIVKSWDTLARTAKEIFKGKHHASAAAEEEEPRNRTRGSSSDQEKRKEYYLVSSLSGNFTNNKDSWLVDSSVSRHMSRYKSGLTNFRKKSFIVQVELGDDASCEIKGIGSISSQLDSGSIIHIDEILYVLGLKKNLILVAILEDKGYKVTFMDGKALLCPKEG